MSSHVVSYVSGLYKAGRGGIRNQGFSPWRCPQTQCLSRLAAAHEPSVYPAWWQSVSPVFIPLGGCPRAQYLSAWRAPNPEHCTKKSLSPLAGEGGGRPEGGNKKPGFIPLDGLLRAQHLPRLAAIGMFLTACRVVRGLPSVRVAGIRAGRGTSA